MSFLSLEIDKVQCGRQTSRSHSTTPTFCCTYTSLRDSLPLSVNRTCGFILTKRIWQRWWDVTPQVSSLYGKDDGMLLQFYVTWDFILAMETLSADFMKCVAMLKMQVAVNYRAFRHCEWPLGIESSFQLTVSRKFRPISHTTIRKRISQQPQWLWSWFFPNQTCRWEYSPCDLLILTLQDPKQKTMLCHVQISDP